MYRIHQSANKGIHKIILNRGQPFIQNIQKYYRSSRRPQTSVLFKPRKPSLINLKWDTALCSRFKRRVLPNVSNKISVVEGSCKNIAESTPFAENKVKLPSDKNEPPPPKINSAEENLKPSCDKKEHPLPLKPPEEEKSQSSCDTKKPVSSKETYAPTTEQTSASSPTSKISSPLSSAQKKQSQTTTITIPETKPQAIYSMIKSHNDIDTSTTLKTPPQTTISSAAVSQINTKITIFPAKLPRTTKSNTHKTTDITTLKTLPLTGFSEIPKTDPTVTIINTPRKKTKTSQSKMSETTTLLVPFIPSQKSKNEKTTSTDSKKKSIMMLPSLNQRKKSPVTTPASTQSEKIQTMKQTNTKTNILPGKLPRITKYDNSQTTAITTPKTLPLTGFSEIPKTDPTITIVNTPRKKTKTFVFKMSESTIHSKTTAFSVPKTRNEITTSTDSKKNSTMMLPRFERKKAPVNLPASTKSEKIKTISQTNTTISLVKSPRTTKFNTPQNTAITTSNELPLTSFSKIPKTDPTITIINTPRRKTKTSVTTPASTKPEKVKTLPISPPLSKKPKTPNEKKSSNNTIYNFKKDPPIERGFEEIPKKSSLPKDKQLPRIITSTSKNLPKLTKVKSMVHVNDSNASQPPRPSIAVTKFESMLRIGLRRKNKDTRKQHSYAEKVDNISISDLSRKKESNSKTHGNFKVDPSRQSKAITKEFPKSVIRQRSGKKSKNTISRKQHSCTDNKLEDIPKTYHSQKKESDLKVDIVKKTYIEKKIDVEKRKLFAEESNKKIINFNSLNPNDVTSKCPSSTDQQNPKPPPTRLSSLKPPKKTFHSKNVYSVDATENPEIKIDTDHENAYARFICKVSADQLNKFKKRKNSSESHSPQNSDFPWKHITSSYPHKNTFISPNQIFEEAIKYKQKNCSTGEDLMLKESLQQLEFEKKRSNDIMQRIKKKNPTGEIKIRIYVTHESKSTPSTSRSTHNSHGKSSSKKNPKNPPGSRGMHTYATLNTDINDQLKYPTKDSQFKPNEEIDVQTIAKVTVLDLLLSKIAHSLQFLKNEETHIDNLPKLSIVAALGNTIEMNITNQEEEDTKLNSPCLTAYDGLKPKDSLSSIVNKLANTYVVKAACNIQNVCYNIKGKQTDIKTPQKNPALNKGMSCVFASVPRKFITTLQMNPLELSIRELCYFGPVDIGKVYIPLYGHIGFTEAVAHHFYEKGYETYTRGVKGIYDIRSQLDNRVVGQMTVHLKLTCHGPLTQEINPPLCLPDQKIVSLIPIFVKENKFDFPREKRQLLPIPMMTYIIDDNSRKLINPEMKKYLQCQKFQEMYGKKHQSCACFTLLDQFKRIIYKHDVMALDELQLAEDITGPRLQGGQDTLQFIEEKHTNNDALQISSKDKSRNDENKLFCICNKLYGSMENVLKVNDAEQITDPLPEHDVQLELTVN